MAGSAGDVLLLPGPDSERMASMHRRIVIVAFEDVQLLDVVGPLEVFSIANRSRDTYRVEIATADGAPITSSSGLGVVPHRALGSVRGPIDTLVVAGGNGTRAAVDDDALVGWVR